MRNSKSDSSKRSKSTRRSWKERKEEKEGWGGVGSRHDIKVSRLIKKPLKS